MSLTLSSVAKAFGSDRAVDGVSLDIEPGEFFAVLGPSGCGKSTLLRLVAGLEVLDGGEIAIGGRRVAGDGLHVPSEKRDVGVVFQSYALWPHMSVAGNVSFPLETAGVARRDARQKVSEYLRTVELEAFADRQPAALSGGQRQRVALARCLAQRAGTILMDEPLANLDPHLRTAMEAELARFHRTTGATILYITHDQREAMALADRLAVMWHGRLLQVGAPDEVYGRPESERVARFIGRSTILDGEIRDVASGRARVAVGGVEMEAGCGNGARHGAAKVVIRPEHLAIVDNGANGNAYPATVERAVYRGGFWEVSAQVPGLGMLTLETRQKAAAGDGLAIAVTDPWVLPTDGENA